MAGKGRTSLDVRRSQGKTQELLSGDKKGRLGRPVPLTLFRLSREVQKLEKGGGLSAGVSGRD